MSQVITALSSTPGRVGRVAGGLAIALVGPVVFGASLVCPFVFVGVVPMYFGIRGRCLLQSALSYRTALATSRS